MERSENSDALARDICCSLLMLLLSLFFCFPLAMLTYLTYETIVGTRQFCSFWIDVSGRIAILLICYYVGSICGFLPLPHRCHLRGFIVPFSVWRLRSWRRLFRNLCFSFPSRSLILRLQRNVSFVHESLETPPLEENNEHLYTGSPRRRRTSPINIPYPEINRPSVFIYNPETTPRNETPGIIKSLNRSVTSIDPSFGDIVLPIMPEKSSNRYYISEATIKESESSDYRDIVPSKYRKRFTETNLPGEAPGNDLASFSDYQAPPGRPVILTSDKKSRALPDDERLTISRRQERRKLKSEMPDMHIKKDLESVPDVKTPATNPTVASELYDKYFDLAYEEKAVTTKRQVRRMSENERPKVDTPNDRLEVLARNELLLETNNQPRVHKRNIHTREGTAASACNRREASVEYLNTETQLNFSRTRNRNHQPQGLSTDPAVAREQPLDDKYFEMTDDENLVDTRLKELQIPRNEKLNVRTTDGRLEVLARKELLPEMNDKPTVHKRYPYFGGASSSNHRGAPPEYRSIEAQLKFRGAHNTNQQSQKVTVNNKQQHPNFRSTETQMNFPGTLGRNQQHDRETASSQRERVARARNNKTSLNFPLFPNIIIRNSKSISAWIKELRKRHLEFVTYELTRYPETRIGRQVHLDRPLVRSVLPNLRSQSVIQTRLPRSHENINLLSRSSFQTQNSKNSDKRTEVNTNTSLGVSDANVGLTTNRYDVTQKQGRINISFSQRMNPSRSLIGRATRRRRQLPSLRFQAYARTLSQIQDKTDVKKNVKLEEFISSDQKSSEHRMADEAGPSNSIKFEGGNKRTGMMKPMARETPNKSFNRSQLTDLRNKLSLMEQSRMHASIEASAAVEPVCTKFPDKKDEDICESSVSTKPSEAEAVKKPHVKIVIDSPLITSESDSDSDPERPK